MDKNNDNPWDLLLNDSRISPNGKGVKVDDLIVHPPPTNLQKIWASVVLGFVFGLLSSPVAYQMTNASLNFMTDTIGINPIPIMDKQGPNVLGMIIHTLIFIVVIRIILW
jgi:hypothetical protein